MPPARSSFESAKVKAWLARHPLIVDNYATHKHPNYRIDREKAQVC
jgi:hypothetical protein